METPADRTPMVESATDNELGSVPLRFITILDPREAKHSSQRRAVRAHAAIYQHRQEQKPGNKTLVLSRKASSRASKTGRRCPPLVSVVLDTDALQSLCAEPGHSSTPEDDDASPTEKKIQLQAPFPICNSILGQGRLDPFKTFPIEWRPHIPAIIDHCMLLFIAATRAGHIMRYSYLLAGNSFFFNISL